MPSYHSYEHIPVEHLLPPDKLESMAAVKQPKTALHKKILKLFTSKPDSIDEYQQEQEAWAAQETMNNIANLSPEEATLIVREVASKYPYAVLNNLRQLPEGVKVPVQVLDQAIDVAPTRIIEIFNRGDIPGISKKQLVQMYFERGSGEVAVANGLVDDMSLDDIIKLAKNQMYARSVNLLSVLESRNIITNEADIEKYITALGIDIRDLYSMLANFTKQLQSYVFYQTYIEKSQGGHIHHGLSFYDLSYYTKLDDRCLDYVINQAPLSSGATDYDSIERLFESAGPEVKARFDATYGKKIDEIRTRALEIKQANSRRADQSAAERTYFASGSMELHAHEATEQLSDEQIINALEYDHVVKEIPEFNSIVDDESRTNIIRAVTDSLYEMSTNDLGSNPRGKVETMTEYQALQDYKRFIRKLPRRTEKAFRDSLDNDLSFIGEKEYNEAAEGIAKYWKSFLDKADDTQVFVSTTVTKDGGYTKSDTYMLDRILGYFSDDELKRYANRLIMHDNDITQKSPDKIKVVLLDDWTISGSQLRSGYGNFSHKYPELVGSMEIQLMIATKDRLAMGLENMTRSSHKGYENSIPTIVRSYYVARQVEDIDHESAHGARITGSHSSVDFGFTGDVNKIKRRDDPMPALSCIVRPYRAKDYEPRNINRLGAASMAKVIDDAYDAGLIIDAPSKEPHNYYDALDDEEYMYYEGEEE